MKQNVPQLTSNLASLLIQHEIKICTAESCTGGLIAKTFTDLDGSSNWFDRGFVTYSNEAKVDMLGVNTSTIDSFGAVSIEVAREMAAGALLHSNSQVSISVTGVAGPGGGTDKKPVGTVCFGFAVLHKSTIQKVISEKQWFEGDRSTVRESSLIFAINHVLEILSEELN